MAPDLNSVPPSPHAAQISPLLMAPVPNILPSNTSAILAASQPSSPAMPARASTTGDNSAVGSGPGPMRHPRPLTAAELHSELEREQEAVVGVLILYMVSPIMKLTQRTGQPFNQRAFHASRCSECLCAVKPLLRLWLRLPGRSRYKPRHLRPSIPSSILSPRKPQSFVLVHQQHQPFQNRLSRQREWGPRWHPKQSLPAQYYCWRHWLEQTE